jgi:hypothetical protein
MEVERAAPRAFFFAVGGVPSPRFRYGLRCLGTAFNGPARRSAPPFALRFHRQPGASACFLHLQNHSGTALSESCYHD